MFFSRGVLDTAKKNFVLSKKLDRVRLTKYSLQIPRVKNRSSYTWTALVYSLIICTKATIKAFTVRISHRKSGKTPFVSSPACICNGMASQGSVNYFTFILLQTGCPFRSFACSLGGNLRALQLRWLIGKKRGPLGTETILNMSPHEKGSCIC